mgnify:CR=1 FL=1
MGKLWCRPSAYCLYCCGQLSSATLPIPHSSFNVLAKQSEVCSSRRHCEQLGAPGEVRLPNCP